MTPTQTQAALLSDAEIAQCINQSRTNLFDRAGTTSFRIARSIEQAVLAKLQPAQEPVQSIPPGLRVGDSHMESLIEAAIQGHAGTRDAMRWLVRQIARVEDKPEQAGELPDEREAFERFVQNCPMGRYSINRRDEGYDSSHTQIMWDAWKARAALAARKPLTGLTREQMEAGRHQVFSTNNPFCPCDSKTFRKVSEWTEREFCRINGLEVKP